MAAKNFRSWCCAQVLGAVTLAALGCASKSSQGGTTTGGASSGGATGGLPAVTGGAFASGGVATVRGGGGSGGDAPVLGCLTPFIPTKCAVATCHDSVSRTFGMDLSTGNGIYASWMNRNGLDNCGSKLVPRVVPGNPDGSFVMRKITGALDCVGSQSQAMPPPPHPPLTPDEINTVRYWILFGAPKNCGDGMNVSGGGHGGVSGAGGTTEGGTTSASGGTLSGAAGGAAGTAGASSTGGDTTGDDFFKCTASQACTGQLLCAGANCSTMPWDCVSHLDIPAGYLAHPCPTETMQFCGCDGVTFEAPPTCPDRPYQHAGPCGDGYNCKVESVVCSDAAPTCPAGQTPSIVNDCYSTCVSALDCRCEFNWHCPEGYQCDRDQWRCVIRPPMDGGT